MFVTIQKKTPVEICKGEKNVFTTLQFELRYYSNV